MGLVFSLLGDVTVVVVVVGTVHTYAIGYTEYWESITSAKVIATGRISTKANVCGGLDFRQLVLRIRASCTVFVSYCFSMFSYVILT